MKKLALTISILLLVASLAACQGDKAGGGKVQVMTTVFPIYDWTHNVSDKSQGVEVNYLLSNGVDMHSYNPSADDAVAIADCDILICTGGESEKWLMNLVAEYGSEDLIVIKLLEAPGAKSYEEEQSKGMQEVRGEEGEELAYDEHCFLSPSNAIKYVERISQALCDGDPQNAEIYRENSEEYISKLRSELIESQASKELRARYLPADGKAPIGKPMIVADRFPFLYLFREYDIPYYAAFAGCSAESEASFQTVEFLADQAEALQCGYILKSEGDSGKLARTIIEATDRDMEIVTLNSMQSVTAGDIENGASYIDIMKENLRVLALVSAD